MKLKRINLILIILSIVFINIFIVYGNSDNDKEINTKATDNNDIWRKNFGGSKEDVCSSIANALDGGYVAVGTSNSLDNELSGKNKGELDAIIVKYDSNGDMLWNKNFGGSYDDAFNFVISDNNNDYVAVGYSNSNNYDLEGVNKGYDDAIIVKYDSYGNVKWKKNFGGDFNDYYNSVAIDTDGGYIAVGDSNSNNGDLSGINKGGSDGVIVKYSSEGDLLWKKTFGGSKEDTFTSIIVNDNEIIVVGYSNSNDYDLNTLNKGGYDGIVVVYDKNGNLKWNKNFGGTEEDRFNSIVAGNNNDYAIVGESRSSVYDLSKGNLDGAILNIDKVGNVKWWRNFGGSLWDSFNSLIKTKSGDYLAIGMSMSYDGNLVNLNKGLYDGVIAKYDDLGDLKYVKTYGGAGQDEFTAIIEKDAGYIATGYSSSNNSDLKDMNKGRLDGVIVKINDDSKAPVVKYDLSKKEWTNEPVNINISALGDYDIDWIRYGNNDYTYDTTNLVKTISQSGIASFTVQDKNLNRKTINININNIDLVNPNKPVFTREDNKLVMRENGDNTEQISMEILENFESENFNFNYSFEVGSGVRSSNFAKNGNYSYKIGSEATALLIPVNIKEEFNNNVSLSYKLDAGNDASFMVVIDERYDEIISDSGQTQWKDLNYTLPPGNHNLTIYFQNGTESVGTNSVYIDDIKVKVAGDKALEPSGVSRVEYNLNNSGFKIYKGPLALPLGDHNIKMKTIDKAGNESEITEENFTVDKISYIGENQDININFTLDNSLEMVIGNDINFGEVSPGSTKTGTSSLNVTSTLPYSIEVKALDNFIGGSDNSNIIPIDILSLAIDSEIYQKLSLSTITLIPNSPGAINKNHNLNFKIDSAIGYKSDNYNAQIEMILKVL